MLHTADLATNEIRSNTEDEHIEANSELKKNSTRKKGSTGSPSYSAQNRIDITLKREKNRLTTREYANLATKKLVRSIEYDPINMPTAKFS